MKYLKLFEEASFDDELKDLILSKINHDLINDICDMALDNIDKGFTLSITIVCGKYTDMIRGNNKIGERLHTELLWIEFNHKKKKYYFVDGYTIEYIKKIRENIESNKIDYFIDLRQAEELRKMIHHSSLKIKNNTLELVDRVREAYPDENIYLTAYRT